MHPYYSAFQIVNMMLFSRNKFLKKFPSHSSEQNSLNPIYENKVTMKYLGDSKVTDI